MIHLLYTKEKELPAFFFFSSFLKKDIFNNSVLGFLQGMTPTLDERPSYSQQEFSLGSY